MIVSQYITPILHSIWLLHLESHSVVFADKSYTAACPRQNSYYDLAYVTDAVGPFLNFVKITHLSTEKCNLKKYNLVEFTYMTRKLRVVEWASEWASGWGSERVSARSVLKKLIPNHFPCKHVLTVPLQVRIAPQAHHNATKGCEQSV